MGFTVFFLPSFSFSTCIIGFYRVLYLVLPSLTFTGFWLSITGFYLVTDQLSLDLPNFAVFDKENPTGLAIYWVFT